MLPAVLDDRGCVHGRLISIIVMLFITLLWDMERCVCKISVDCL